jgi:hypothetical protein
MTDDDVKEISKVQLSDLEPGEIFTAGEKRFIVLNHFGDTTTIIEADTREDTVFDDDNPNWISSSLRNHLNINVLKEYEEMFGAENIVETETDLTTVDGLKNYGTCDDKIRLLTFGEYRTYQGLFKREEKWEWTCTPWTIAERGYTYSVCVVSPMGVIDYRDCYCYSAVRPFCILKSNIFVSKEGK